MKFIGLNGREYSVDISKMLNKERANASKLHQQARELINNIFSLDIIVEEFSIPGLNLYADFFIPRKHLIIEVNGAQHYSYNSFYHNSYKDFSRSMARDEIKKEWASLNDIIVVDLPYNKIPEWEKIIRENI